MDRITNLQGKMTDQTIDEFIAKLKTIDPNVGEGEPIEITPYPNKRYGPNNVNYKACANSECESTVYRNKQYCSFSCRVEHKKQLANGE